LKSLKAISLINISLLKTTYADLWQRVVIHRFIADLGDGLLPIEKFRRYFFQDYVFVNDQSKPRGSRKRWCRVSPLPGRWRSFSRH